MTKALYLKQVEEAYKIVGQATAIIGLYLTEPFAGSEKGAAKAAEARQQAMDLEETLRGLYTIENMVERY